MPAASPASTPRPGSGYANYVLGVLVLLYIVNYVDRQVLAVLLQPIKEELAVSDTAMGLLTGLAFAFFYTTAGIPIARMADRGTRVTVITIGVIVWSGMTVLSGFARSFAQLAAARVGVGVGEAALSPAAHSLLSDYFPATRRATALSIYNIGGNLGIMLGFIAGGWIGEVLGWRTAFFVVGLPGLAAALLVRLTVREPPRGAIEGIDADSGVPSVREVFAHMGSLRSFRHLAFAASLYAFAA
jgi:MFS family permease